MMNNRKVFRKEKITYAIVGDGGCEVWYFQMLKQSENLIINIKPELSLKTSLKKQYEHVKNLAETYHKVFWIVDYDVIEKETKECKTRDEKRSKEFARYYTELSKLENVEILVVNTCFEYSKKNYKDCDETGKDLKKEFAAYEKTEKFYKKNNADIYSYLKPNLPTAIKHASKLGTFDIQNPNNPVCEIHKLFNNDGSFKVD